MKLRSSAGRYTAMARWQAAIRGYPIRMKSGAVMDACSLSFVVQACAGLLRSGTLELTVRRVCTDSRHVQPGDLFVALAGGKFDGHGFLAEAAAKGAVAALVCCGRVAEAVPGLALIEVEDTRVALGKLSAAYRLKFNLAVAAVGGSNGKTTTKELIASVLRQRLCTLWSEASFNNDIGVPLSLLRLEERHQAAVLEVGTNHPGELAPLVRMIRPQYGVITSIGREHLEFFGDLEGVAREEGTLGELLPARGVLFLNGDCEWSESLAKRSPAQVVRVGFSERNDWRVTEFKSTPEGISFLVKGPGEASEPTAFSLKLLGRHQIVNALFAVALGRDLGIPMADIQRGLAQCQPPRMRMEVWEHNGVRVLDDAYNANADSMLAALRTLRDVPCKGRRVAVLGDMAELGAHSLSAHQEVGRGAAELGVGQLFAVGKMAPIMGEAARRAGLTRVLEFMDVESAVKAVRSFVKEGDVLLVKASRATRLERVSEALRRN